MNGPDRTVITCSLMILDCDEMVLPAGAMSGHEDWEGGKDDGEPGRFRRGAGGGGDEENLRPQQGPQALRQPAPVPLLILCTAIIVDFF